MARGRGALRLLREHRERRLEAVGEVAGLGLGARDRALALVEQRVQVAHERLHLARVVPLDPRVAAVAHVARSRARSRSNGAKPLRTCDEAPEHAAERDQQWPAACA